MDIFSNKLVLILNVTLYPNLHNSNSINLILRIYFKSQILCVLYKYFIIIVVVVVVVVGFCIALLSKAALMQKHLLLHLPKFI